MYKFSIARLLIIGTSSHIISFTTCNNLAKPDCLLIPQVILFSISSGILSLECVVRLSSNINIATPEETVAREIKFLDLTVASIVRYKYV